MVPQLNKLHLARISQDKEFNYLYEDLDELKEKREIETVSLNLEKRQTEREEEEEKRLARKKEREELKSDDSEDTDVLISESAHILSDMLMLSDGKLAKRK